MPSWWYDRRPHPAPGPVGLMADSHGDGDAIAAGLACLRKAGCRTLVHLGDICDSARRDTAGACIARVMAGGMWAVRGNNDHVLLAAGGPGLDPDARGYLARLPLVIETPTAVFTHNRPRVAVLGTTALIGDLAESEVQRFRSDFPKRLLFRGHSHRPMLRLPGPPQASLRDLTPSPAPQPVSGGTVITCGSVADGTVLVWEADTVHLLRFDG